jgi:hypothetical protein
LTSWIVKANTKRVIAELLRPKEVWTASKHPEISSLAVTPVEFAQPGAQRSQGTRNFVRFLMLFLIFERPIVFPCFPSMRCVARKTQVRTREYLSLPVPNTPKAT